MDRPMVAAHDAVSEEVAMLVGGRQYRNNRGGGGARGGSGNNTNPLHQDGQRMRGGGQNYWDGVRSA